MTVGRAAGVAAVLLAAGAGRRRMLTSGATPDEVRATWPGDALVPSARASTMATTIAAPPGAVWPWLVQMGADRAGFYSWDRLDNGGRPSAERIHPEWQDLRAGERVLSLRDGSVWFDVALVEPERTLVLRASLALPRATPFDPRDTARPRAYSDSIWAFHLRPTPEGHTRLVVRGRGTGRPALLLALADLLFWQPAHWVMQRKQFAELRRRAENYSAPVRSGPDARVPVPA